MSDSEEIIKNRSFAYRILVAESLTVVFFGILFLIFTGYEFVYSVVCGGVAFILPNAFFIMFSLRSSPSSSSKKVLFWFYFGEFIKIFMTVLIFLLSFIFVKPMNIGLMFVSYGFVLLMNLVGLAFFMKK